MDSEHVLYQEVVTPEIRVLPQIIHCELKATPALGVTLMFVDVDSLFSAIDRDWLANAVVIAVSNKGDFSTSLVINERGDVITTAAMASEIRNRLAVSKETPNQDQ